MRTPENSQKTRTRLLWAAGIGALALAAFFTLRTIQHQKEEGVSLFTYFSSHSIKAVTLKLDLQAVYGKDSADFPARLDWTDKDGREFGMPVEIAIRGKNRKEVCSFPPLKLTTFENKEIGAREGCFKLVTHCTENGGEKLLFREYLVYKLYEKLSNASFQSRLIEVTYEDREGDGEPVRSWAILLEPKEDMMERLDAEEAAIDGGVREISSTDYNRFAVFQFMIGNTDWNLDKEHNVKLLVSKNGGSPYPVPYDFDRSGLVNAPYAEPYFSLPIHSVRDRYFQWRGKDRTQLVPVLELFKERKYDLLGVCWDFELLSIQDRQDIALYLEEFYSKIDLLLGEGRRVVHSSVKTQAGIG